MDEIIGKKTSHETEKCPQIAQPRPTGERRLYERHGARITIFFWVVMSNEREISELLEFLSGLSLTSRIVVFYVNIM
jgi:hypothetical protein